MNIIRARLDADEKLVEAFQELLAVIGQHASPLKESIEGLVEAGRPTEQFVSLDSNSGLSLPGSWPEELEKSGSNEAFEAASSTILDMS
jgi:hypothetical protein